MAMVTELEVMRGLSHQGDLATITTKCPISSVSSGDQQSPQDGTTPQGDQPASWWQVGHLGPLLSWKG